MSRALHLLLLAACVALARASSYRANTMTPPINAKCVGVGKACQTDLEADTKDTGGGCNSNQHSLCTICNDKTLTCFGGICHPRAQLLNAPCNNTLLQFCAWGLQCNVNGTCDITGGVKQNYAAINEPCTTSQDCYGNPPYCNIADTNNRFCAHNTTIGIGDCSVDTDCAWGYFCNVTNTGNNKCLYSLGNPLKNTNKAPIVGQVCTSLNMRYGQQCGPGYVCRSNNALTPSNVPGYGIGTCQKPYSVNEGGLCDRNDDCKSGWCNGGTCETPDTSHQGVQCDLSAECGRGSQCSSTGIPVGGRTRCYTPYTSNYDPYTSLWSCAAQHQCQIIQSTNGQPIIVYGSCAYNNCSSTFNSIAWAYRPTPYKYNSAPGCGGYKYSGLPNDDFALAQSPHYALLSLFIVSLLAFFH